MGRPLVREHAYARMSDHQQLADPHVLRRDPGSELTDHPGLRLNQRKEFLARRQLGPGHRT